MTLSVATAISAADIVNVKCYKDMKVYLLQGTDGSEVVIKIDAVSATQIKATTLAVKAVDPANKMKILTATERQELTNYCQYVADIDEYFNEIGLVSRVESQMAAVAMLKQSLTFPDPFAKMAKQTVHNIEDAAKERGKGNKDLMRGFVAGLKANGGLEGLGQVVAVDLFNNNRDRFAPDSHTTPKIGPFTFNLRAIVNLGNVMMIDTGAGFKPTALDYADPNAKFRSPAAALDSFEDDDDKWTGRLLANSARRKAFAADIVHDLESLFNPKKSKFSLKTKLGRDATDRVNAGMVQGTRAICQYLNARSKVKNITPALLSRYNLLKSV